MGAIEDHFYWYNYACTVNAVSELCPAPWRMPTFFDAEDLGGVIFGGSMGDFFFMKGYRDMSEDGAHKDPAFFVAWTYGLSIGQLKLPSCLKWAWHQTPVIQGEIETIDMLSVICVRD
jgi:hypothetical protein